VVRALLFRLFHICFSKHARFFWCSFIFLFSIFCGGLQESKTHDRMWVLEFDVGAVQAESS
jgi:hypothetical protein